MNLLIAIYFGIVGLCVGSFLNVVAFRTLVGLSYAKGRSHCPHCGKSLRTRELIPVLSYLLQRGACANCKNSISRLYPFGEAICGIGFFIAAYRLGLQPELLVALTLVSVLVTVTQTDLKAMLIPNRIVYPSIAAIAIMRVTIHEAPYWTYVLSALGGFILLLAIAILGEMALKREAMGGGDIKLYLFIGFALGWPETPLSLFFASVTGLLYGVASRLADKKTNYSKELPFGPFLALGSFIAYMWGELFLSWYFELFA